MCVCVPPSPRYRCATNACGSRANAARPPAGGGYESAERDASYYALTTPERYHQHVTTYLRALDKNGDGVVSRSEQSAKKNDSSDVKVAIVGTCVLLRWKENSSYGRIDSNTCSMPSLTMRGTHSINATLIAVIQDCWPIQFLGFIL